MFCKRSCYCSEKITAPCWYELSSYSGLNKKVLSACLFMFSSVSSEQSVHFISHHLIGVWSYQMELHHLLTFSLPSVNIPKLKPVRSFHQLSLTFCKYQMSDLWRDSRHLPQVYVNCPYEAHQKEYNMFTAKHRTDKLCKLTSALKKLTRNILYHQ